jgi:hypothetical protein
MTECFECKHSIEIDHELTTDDGIEIPELKGVIWGGTCKVSGCVEARKKIFAQFTGLHGQDLEDAWGKGGCVIIDDNPTRSLEVEAE